MTVKKLCKRLVIYIPMVLIAWVEISAYVLGVNHKFNFVPFLRKMSGWAK